MPAALKQGQRFVCWREVVRDGKPTKVPVDPSTGREAKSDDPATWTTLGAAVEYYADRADSLLGLGRMFDPDDGFVGIDFDDCLDDHGNIIPGTPAAEWLPRLNSYSEVSPSGTGIKTWVRAEVNLDGKSGRRNA